MHKNKYHNTATTVDGVKFHSIAESYRYIELKIMEKGGMIHGLELQPKFLLQEKFRHPTEGLMREINYIADFSYIEKDRKIVEDVKGMKTKEYILKKKLFLKLYPNLIFREIK